jgi:hypothetical protein
VALERNGHQGGVMLWRNDATASPLLVYVLLPITLGGAWLTLRLLSSYMRGRAAYSA